MIDFPSGPAVNQVFNAAGMSWRWDGVKWEAYNASTIGPGDITSVVAGHGLTGGGLVGDVTVALQIPVAVADGGSGATSGSPGPYLPIAGGTLTGGLAVTGNLTATGAITSNYGGIDSGGSNAILGFAQRDNPSVGWGWYASAGLARLWNSSNGDLAAISSPGVLSLGGKTAIQLAGNYIQISDQAGNGAIYCGGAGDPANYYRNTNHNFANIGGATTILQMNTAQTTLQSGVLIPGATNTVYCGGYYYAWSAVYAFGFPTPSDRRLKTDIEDLPPCLDLVTRLAPRRFRWAIGSEENRRDTHWGFIAQDVGEVFAGLDFGGHQVHPPDAEHPEGGESIAYNELTAVLWAAVRELTARIDHLDRKSE